MALFDFFKKLSFFSGRSVEGLHEEDLDFQKWIALHRDWRRRLLEYIDGISAEELDEKVICQDNRCELGKWIHGNGSKFYGKESIFQRMAHDHAAFHLSAGKVVSLLKNKNERLARRTLNSEFDMHSMHVVNALEQLERRVKS